MAGMVAEVGAVGMAVGVEAVAITAGAVGLLRFTAEVAAGMAEAVATMVLPMVPWPTWVMGGVVTAFRLAACHTDLLVTPSAATVITTLPIISVTIS